MTQGFDPYHKWLAIPPHEQPANHYRLLGLDLFESDSDVVDSAADKCMAHLRTLQAGKNGLEAQKLLNEVSAARVCLLNPQKRAAYDDELRAQMTEPLPPIESNEQVFNGDMNLQQVESSSPALKSISSQAPPSMTNRIQGTPTWVLPLAIVGAVVGLLAIIVLINLSGDDENHASNPPERPKVNNDSPTLPNSSNNESSNNAGDEDPADPGQEWIDLLALVDLNQDLMHGEWERTSTQDIKVVQHAPARHELFSLPVEIEGSYELEIEFTRVDGIKNALAVVLPIQDTHARVSIDGWPYLGGMSGIDFVDGKPTDQLPNPNKDFKLTNGFRHKILINVEQKDQDVAISALVDNTKVVKYRGAISALSVPKYLGGNPNKLPVIGTYGSEFRIHAARLRMLSGTSKLLR